MAFNIDAHLLNPAILRALTRAVRVLTADELAALRSEIASDPASTGYKAEGGGLKSAHELAGLLNTSGRTTALFPGTLLEAADIIQAVQSATDN